MKRDVRFGMAVATAAALSGMLGPAMAQGTSFEQIMNAQQTAQGRDRTVRLTPVREAALQEAALLLGTQWGLGDRSREIAKQVEQMAAQLDRRYEFGALLMGVGYLPPVFSEARNSVAIEGATMRFGKVIYTMDEPPRPVRIAPTWRDWLYVGLDTDLRPDLPSNATSLPRDEEERIYWRQRVVAAYEEGRRQADEVFNLNLARLDRTYDGMRRYYDLVKRGIVKAPVIATASEIAKIEDPNTLVVGNMVFSISVQAQFEVKPDKWVPLAE